MKAILTMQELIRENETLKNKIAKIEDIKLQMKIAESTDAIALYKKDCKLFNDYKKDLRTSLESSSAYTQNAIKVADSGKHTIAITDNFSITPYKKESLDKKSIQKFYKQKELDVPMMVDYISKFNILEDIKDVPMMVDYYISKLDI